jgi:hypothetical protein
MSNRKLFPESITQLPDAGLTPHGLLVHNAEAPQLAEPMTALFSFKMQPDVQANLEEKVANGRIDHEPQMNTDEHG